LIINA